MLYILSFLYLCLLSCHIFSMEMIELETIPKVKKIKTVDEAHVVASFSSEQWLDYTLSSNVIVDIITQKKSQEYSDKLNKTIKQQIKNLKKEPDKFAQLTHEIFTELSNTNFPSILREIKTVRNESDLYYLIQRKINLKELQEGLLYYEKKEEKWNEFSKSGKKMILCLVVSLDIFFNIMALTYTGVFAQDCWS